jgi:hypothetical protein
MARSARQLVDRILLQALACGATVETAASKAGVCERTVYRRLADPAFGQRLSQLRVEMLQRTADMLTGAGMASVKTLVELQSDVAVPAAVRRRSARDILELGVQLREVGNLERRVAALEQQFSQGDSGPASSPASRTGRPAGG